MRKVLTGIFASFMLFVFVMPIAAVAQDDSTTGSSEELSVEERRAADRQARIDAYKDRVTDRITAAQERRIAGACQAAQGKLTALRRNISDVAAKRKNVYARISDKLEEVTKKLEAASVDTAEFEAAIIEMDRLAAEVISAVETYQETLTDLSEMDCTADPEGFQAALTTAREQRKNIVSAAVAIKDYVNNTIKTILQNIRAEITNNAADDAAEES